MARAKADCERTDAPLDAVHGALFQIAGRDRQALDKAEGLETATTPSRSAS